MSQIDVGILMGSKSDLEIMKKAKAAIEEFGLKAEMRVLSAHRTPNETVAYVESARERGIKVMIAGAGGAAHLAGVVASATTLPVVAVPINASISTMDGLDSLLSMVQMPSGVPVATVAVDGAKNAGILAVQIIGATDSEIAAKLDQYKKDMAEKVLETDRSIQD